MAQKDDRDNRSNQLNPNNSAYWSSRQSSDDGDDDGAIAPETIVHNYAMTSNRPSSIGDKPVPTDCFPCFKHSIELLVHYVTNDGHLNGMIVEAESINEIVAACEVLWGSSKFLFLRALTTGKVYFLRDREPETEDFTLRAKVAAALKEARSYPKPADSDSLMQINVLSLTKNIRISVLELARRFQA